MLALMALAEHYQIRVAEARDIAGMARIRAQEWQTDQFWMDRISPYLRGEHHPQHALAERVALVAVEEDRVLGFAAGHRTTRSGCEGELQWINVATERRGRGIADQLMAVQFHWFREHDANRVCVNVEPENEPARRLYVKHGAARLSDYWMVWTDLRKALVSSSGAGLRTQG